MPSATIEFQNVEVWDAGLSPHSDLDNIVDGDDGTFGTIVADADDQSSSVRLWNPSLPGDFGSVDNLDIRIRWSFSANAGGQQPSEALIYSRESDGAAWVQRLRTEVDGATPEIDTIVSLPVTNLANLQILVENFNAPGGGGDPDLPDVEKP